MPPFGTDYPEAFRVLYYIRTSSVFQADFEIFAGFCKILKTIIKLCKHNANSIDLSRTKV